MTSSSWVLAAFYLSFCAEKVLSLILGVMIGTSNPVLFYGWGFGNTDAYVLAVPLLIVAQPSAGPGYAQALFSSPAASNTVVQW